MGIREDVDNRSTMRLPACGVDAVLALDAHRPRAREDAGFERIPQPACAIWNELISGFDDQNGRAVADHGPRLPGTPFVNHRRSPRIQPTMARSGEVSRQLHDCRRSAASRRSSAVSCLSRSSSSRPATRGRARATALSTAASSSCARASDGSVDARWSRSRPCISRSSASDSTSFDTSTSIRCAR